MKNLKINELGMAQNEASEVKGGGLLLPAIQKVRGSISGDADDRPTEEVAFYYNKIG